MPLRDHRKLRTEDSTPLRAECACCDARRSCGHRSLRTALMGAQQSPGDVSLFAGPIADAMRFRWSAECQVGFVTSRDANRVPLHYPRGSEERIGCGWIMVSHALVAPPSSRRPVPARSTTEQRTPAPSATRSQCVPLPYHAPYRSAVEPQKRRGGSAPSVVRRTCRLS